MTNNAKPNGFETDISKATQAFEEMLTPPEEQEAVEENTDVEEVSEETEAETEIEAQEEIQEDEAEAQIEEEAEEEEEQELQEDQVEVDETEELQTYVVKVGGEEIEVTQEELINGYSRNSDYTRKTQELSELRKDLDNKQSELDSSLSDINRERAEYRELLPKIKTMLQNGFKEEPNWESLREQDQVEYLTKKQEWDEHLNKIKSVDAEYNRITEQERAERQEKLHKQLLDSQQKLSDLLPEWKDEKVKMEEISQITKTAESLGFTKEEVNSVTDYRFILLLRDASLYNKQKTALKKKPTQAKARTKLAKPGTSNRIKQTSSVKKAQQRVAKTGKVSDAANYFEKII